MPKISGTDEGIWRRIHKIPFNLKLKAEEVDKQLEGKLKNETSGILNWLIEGCLQWQKVGELNPPEVVKQATLEYRNEMDSIGDFISDCIRESAGAKLENSDLYKAFTAWYYSSVGDSDIPTHKQLSSRMKKSGFVPKAGKTRKWLDIKIVEEDSTIADEERLVTARLPFHQITPTINSSLIH
jgi:putative DNA primase/helicase